MTEKARDLLEESMAEISEINSECLRLSGELTGQLAGARKAKGEGYMIDRMERMDAAKETLSYLDMKYLALRRAMQSDWRRFHSRPTDNDARKENS